MRSRGGCRRECNCVTFCYYPCLFDTHQPRSLMVLKRRSLAMSSATGSCTGRLLHSRRRNSIPALLREREAGRRRLLVPRGHPVRKPDRDAVVVQRRAGIAVGGDQRPAPLGAVGLRICTRRRKRGQVGGGQARGRGRTGAPTPCVACVIMTTTEPRGQASLRIASGLPVTGCTLPRAHSMMSSSVRPAPVSLRKRCEPGTVLRLPLLRSKPLRYQKTRMYPISGLSFASVRSRGTGQLKLWREAFAARAASQSCE
eukprot:COSAG06_NODE_100_length_24132_cov_93.237507_17_plen_256_part_00